MVASVATDRGVAAVDETVADEAAESANVDGAIVGGVVRCVRVAEVGVDAFVVVGAVVEAVPGDVFDADAMGVVLAWAETGTVSGTMVVWMGVMEDVLKKGFDSMG